MRTTSRLHLHKSTQILHFSDNKILLQITDIVNIDTKIGRMRRANIYKNITVYRKHVQKAISVFKYDKL